MKKRAPGIAASSFFVGRSFTSADRQPIERIPVNPPVERAKDVISQCIAEVRSAVVEPVCPVDGWSVAQHCRRAS